MIDTDSAEHYSWGDGCDGWHLVKNGELSVIQERMPPGTSEARHFHSRSRQFFYILSGVAVVEAGGKRETLRIREGIEILPGVAHQIFNESDEDVEFLVISQPPSHGDRTAAESLEQKSSDVKVRAKECAMFPGIGVNADDFVAELNG